MSYFQDNVRPNHGSPPQLIARLAMRLDLPVGMGRAPPGSAYSYRSAARLQARPLADELDIVGDNGGPRRPQKKGKTLTAPTH